MEHEDTSISGSSMFLNKPDIPLQHYLYEEVLVNYRKIIQLKRLDAPITLSPVGVRSIGLAVLHGYF